MNFWYAGCPPCRAEAPTLNALATTYAGDVQFVGVNVSDDSVTAAGFERTYKSTYPSIVDQEEGASVQLAFASSKPPKAVPSTLVLDRKGRVVARIVGLANKSILNQLHPGRGRRDGDVTLAGGLLLGAPVAIAAGALSFASPCVLPLVPGYLGFVGGVDRSGDRARGRMVLGAALFVLGFSLVFVLTFVVFAAAGLLPRSSGRT